MKISKVAASTARRIFGLCQKDGHLDKARLRDAVAKIIELKPRDYRAILAAIQRLARLESARRSVIIESAETMPDADRQRVAGNLRERYGNDLTFDYKETPELLGGLRIRVGDDVFDGSVKGRIDRLSAAF
jgi:F-type H+-transporting ATPase subunit delta